MALPLEQPNMTPDEYREYLDQFTFNELVPIQSMFFESTVVYGRPVREATLTKMMRKGYNPSLSPIYLSLRKDGRYAIVDGNHRVELAKRLGYTKMHAKVFIDLTIPEEAEHYTKLNDYKDQSVMDRFRAKVIAGNPEALLIVAELQKYNLQPAFSHNPSGPFTNQIQAIGAFERLLAEQGPVGLAEVVYILHSAWEHRRRAWIAQMIDGMKQFWIRYRGEMQKDYLIDRLKLVSPEMLLADAGVSNYSTRSPGTRVGETIWRHYNRRKKEGYKLPEWKDHIGSAHTKPRKLPPKSPPPSSNDYAF